MHSLPAYPGSPAQPPEGLQACLAARRRYMVGDDGYCISGSARPSSHPSEHVWLLELVRDGWLTVFTCRSWGTVASANLCCLWNPGGTQPPSQLPPGLPAPHLPSSAPISAVRPSPASGRWTPCLTASTPGTPSEAPQGPRTPASLGKRPDRGERDPSTASSGFLEGRLSH